MKVRDSVRCRLEVTELRLIQINMTLIKLIIKESIFLKSRFLNSAANYVILKFRLYTCIFSTFLVQSSNVTCHLTMKQQNVKIVQFQNS